MRREINPQLIQSETVTAQQDREYALVVDRDFGIRQFLGEILYRDGLMPLLASSGAEAIELMAGAAAPVLVVLAFRLPDMPAADLLARLRTDERWARARVLLLSTAPRSHLPDDLAFDGLVANPLDTRSVLATVHAVMARRPPSP